MNEIDIKPNEGNAYDEGSFRKDKMKEYNREYRMKNKEKIAEYKKLYHLQNKERMNERNRMHYINNKEKIKRIRSENKEKIKKYTKEYRLLNKDKFQQYEREYYLEKRRPKIRELSIKKNIEKNNGKYIPRRSWLESTSLREYFDSISPLLHISVLSDWYRISRTQINQVNGKESL